MLALTLQTPWPFAFTDLGKRIENRPWAPRPSRLRPGDTFALHGGKTPGEDIQRMRLGHLAHELKRCPWGVYERYQESYRDIEGIFALAIFGGIVTESDSPWFVGPKGWTIPRLAVLPEPVPCRGAQGLWRVPDGIIDQVLGKMAFARWVA